MQHAMYEASWPASECGSRRAGTPGVPAAAGGPAPPAAQGRRRASRPAALSVLLSRQTGRPREPPVHGAVSCDRGRCFGGRGGRLWWCPDVESTDRGDAGAGGPSTAVDAWRTARAGRRPRSCSARLEPDGLARGCRTPGQRRRPASGSRVLAALGELDLTLGRLAEAHADAVAILRELDAGAVPARAAVGRLGGRAPDRPG